MYCRLGRAFAALAACLVLAACGEPPTREMDMARDAIATARAARADQYAPGELSAAETALEKSTEAVAGKDFKLALNHALTSHERAQAARQLAVEAEATLRTEVGQALDAADAHLTSARATVETAAAARTRALRRAATTAGRKLDTAERQLQEARALTDQGELTTAADRVREATAQINETVAALPPLHPPAAPRR